MQAERNAGLAQLAEHLFCTQNVAGSNPVSGSIVTLRAHTGCCSDASYFSFPSYFSCCGSSVCGAAALI